jgi:hypothetical protein
LLDVAGEPDLRVVFWRVAQDGAGVGKRPEGAGIIADTIHHLPGNTVFIGDIGRFNGFREELCQVTRADVSPQIALVIGHIILVQTDIQLSRCPNSYHDNAHFATFGQVRGMALATGIVAESAEPIGKEKA